MDRNGSSIGGGSTMWVAWAIFLIIIGIVLFFRNKKDPGVGNRPNPVNNVKVEIKK